MHNNRFFPKSELLEKVDSVLEVASEKEGEEKAKELLERHSRLESINNWNACINIVRLMILITIRQPMAGDISE